MSEKTEKTMTQEEMREAYRMYQREYRKKNPGKQKVYTERYILKKAKELEARMRKENENAN